MPVRHACPPSWDPGRPAADQCEGCTFYNGQIGELSSLHSRDITYATFCHGPYEESVRYRDFMGWDLPWYSGQASAGAPAGKPDTPTTSARQPLSDQLAVVPRSTPRRPASAVTIWPAKLN